MKIAVITCLWGREDVAKLMLDHLSWTKELLAPEGIELSVLACGSEGDKTRALARSRGAFYMEYENKPVGRKFNAALKGALGLNPDAVTVLGSDNLVNADMFRAWAALLEEGVEYMGFLDGYMYDTVSGALVHWHGYKDAARIGDPLGSGRTCSRKLLDRAEWRLWDSRKDQSLDWSVTQRMKILKPKARVAFMEAWGIRHIGLKTPENISSFQNLLLRSENNITRLDPSLLEGWFGVETTERIFSLPKVSTVQVVPEVADPSRGRRRKPIKIVSIDERVECPRCGAKIAVNRAIQMGVKLANGEKFVCFDCALREQEEQSAERKGVVLQAHDVVQRVPEDQEGVHGGVPDREGSQEEDGGRETEGDDGGSIDFPEDVLNEDLGRSE